MPTSSVVFWAVSILVTVVATWLISIYYTKPKLAAYKKFGSSLFDGVKEEIREDLELTYRGRRVDDLFHMEVVVINRGHQPIQDYVDPLTLPFPEGVSVLDSAIVETSSPNLEVEDSVGTEDGMDKVTFDFPLLNSGDWFTAKLLLERAIDPEDLTFTIRAADVSSEVSLEDEERAVYSILAPALLVVAAVMITVTVFYDDLLMIYFGADALSELVWYFAVPVGLMSLLLYAIIALFTGGFVIWVAETIRPTPPPS